ncbi:hypothetical protein V5P93_003303 [Actinokineospora auranticolor]|uniref:Uncharacterized protein n=1 Tax=Actinokineospora auranticolor TaxID=155976 RepID=A0A2S6H1Y9_9PSEU|nr:hypothetical protein [Actinokineospora auranticolor]PPK71437.1 hypothetical protein CLV40_101627 [Actinokineospora auranticolor]
MTGTEPPCAAKIGVGPAVGAAPLLVTAGVLTGAGAAVLTNTLIAVAVVSVLAAAGPWWRHRRRAHACRGTCSC